MTRATLRRFIAADSGALLDRLTELQHTRPHDRIETILTRLTVEASLCHETIFRAMSWLSIDRQRPVGRLRRTELTQLARCLHRFARQGRSDQQAAGAQPGETVCKVG